MQAVYDLWRDKHTFIEEVIPLTWKYTRSAADGCIYWTGKKNVQGYPRLTLPPRHSKYGYSVRELAWVEHHKQPLPAGTVVSSLCRNRLCCSARACLFALEKGQAQRASRILLLSRAGLERILYGSGRKMIPDGRVVTRAMLMERG